MELSNTRFNKLYASLDRTLSVARIMQYISGIYLSLIFYQISFATWTKRVFILREIGTTEIETVF